SVWSSVSQILKTPAETWSGSHQKDETASPSWRRSCPRCKRPFWLLLMRRPRRPSSKHCDLCCAPLMRRITHPHERRSGPELSDRESRDEGLGADRTTAAPADGCRS